MLHLGPIWYHSEPSNVPYSENLSRPISWFGLFLQQNDSSKGFLFCSVWAARPVHKKKVGGDYEQLLRVSFHVFRVKIFEIFFENTTGLLLRDWLFRLGHMELQKLFYHNVVLKRRELNLNKERCIIGLLPLWNI